MAVSPVFGLILGLSLSACGQVSRDGDGNPNPNNPGPTPTPSPTTPSPTPTPKPTAESTVCPSAPIDDASAIALWTTRGQELVFVRHDASELVAHEFTASLDNTGVHIQAVNGRVLAFMMKSWTEQRAELVLFDRFGEKLDQLELDRPIEHAYLNEDGSVAISAYAEPNTAVTLRWNGGEPVEVAHGWAPIGAAKNGAFAMRAGWDPSVAYGFLMPGTNTIEPFTSETQMYMVSNRLVTLDSLKENVVIHSPSGTTLVPIVELTGGGDWVITQGRDEGWIAVAPEWQWEPPASRQVAIVNLNDATARLVEGPTLPEPVLGMYCDNARTGYVASDGSVLFSGVDSDGLRVVRYPVGGGAPESIGKPLTKVALLDVVERSSGFYVLGSDGNDTYCGSGEDWPLPASPNAEPGDSLFAGRIGAATPLRELEFGGTWWARQLDASGSCLIGAGAGDEPAESPHQITDLVEGTAFVPPAGDLQLTWVE